MEVVFHVAYREPLIDLLKIFGYDPVIDCRILMLTYPTFIKLLK